MDDRQLVLTAIRNSEPMGISYYNLGMLLYNQYDLAPVVAKRIIAELLREDLIMTSGKIFHLTGKGIKHIAKLNGEYHPNQVEIEEPSPPKEKSSLKKKVLFWFAVIGGIAALLTILDFINKYCKFVKNT